MTNSAAKQLSLRAAHFNRADHIIVSREVANQKTLTIGESILPVGRRPGNLEFLRKPSLLRSESRRLIL